MYFPFLITIPKSKEKLLNLRVKIEREHICTHYLLTALNKRCRNPILLSNSPS